MHIVLYASALGRSPFWPYPEVHLSSKDSVGRSASSSNTAVKLCRPWTSLVCPDPKSNWFAVKARLRMSQK